MTRGADPAALTDDHSPDHWVHAGRHYARTLGDIDRIGSEGVRNALAALEQHLTDGCPEQTHRHITDGTCRHIIRAVATQVTSNATYPHTDSPETSQGRTAPRIICGQPLPCPLHQTAQLQGVEAEVARRTETTRLGDRMVRETDALLIATGRLRSTIEQITRLNAAPTTKPERCCGGWGDSADPTCGEAAGHWPYRGGIMKPTCDRCYQRSSKADRRAS